MHVKAIFLDSKYRMMHEGKSNAKTYFFTMGRIRTFKQHLGLKKSALLFQKIYTNLYFKILTFTKQQEFKQKREKLTLFSHRKYNFQEILNASEKKKKNTYTECKVKS